MPARSRASLQAPAAHVTWVRSLLRNHHRHTHPQAAARLTRVSSSLTRWQKRQVCARLQGPKSAQKGS